VRKISEDQRKYQEAIFIASHLTILAKIRLGTASTQFNSTGKIRSTSRLPGGNMGPAMPVNRSMVRLR